jgi:choline dehydrogenase-like flavoprotein
MYGNFIGFSGRGEMIPNPDTFCEIDPKVVDKWGIPVLRFHFAWSDHEIKMAKDMQETFTAIVEAAGGTVFGGGRRDPEAPQNDVRTGGRPYGISEGGEIIHELGTARMGDDPKTSVLNKYSQAHDVKNLFVGDGASFVTGPDKNPTLTITALSWRMSEHLLDQAKKGEI